MTPAATLAKAIAGTKRAPKYRNTKTVVDGITFDSKREAARYGELRLLERAGRIGSLTLQPRYELAESVKFDGSARRKPAMVYVADFSYVEVDGDKRRHIVEDVKGIETEAFRIKRHLMLALLGIDVRIVK